MNNIFKPTKHRLFDLWTDIDRVKQKTDDTPSILFSGTNLIIYGLVEPIDKIDYYYLDLVAHFYVSESGYFAVFKLPDDHIEEDNFDLIEKQKILSETVDVELENSECEKAPSYYKKPPSKK